MSEIFLIMLTVLNSFTWQQKRRKEVVISIARAGLSEEVITVVRDITTFFYLLGIYFEVPKLARKVVVIFRTASVLCEELSGNNIL